MMKVKPILILFIIINSTAFGQTRHVCWSGWDMHINYLADSLNFANDKTKLPRLLDDYLIDWKLGHTLSECLEDKQEIISLRVALMNRVVNEQVLTWIINSEDRNYDKKYVPRELAKEKHSIYDTFPDLPYMEFSIRELAQERLNEVRKRKKELAK